jgi:hypothetical protein
MTHPFFLAAWTVRKNYDSPSHLVARVMPVWCIRSFWYVTGITHRPLLLIAHVLVITKNTNCDSRALKPIVTGI